jgi:hypothetical protein
MKMKLNINKETKSVVFYFRRSDLINLIQQCPPERAALWFSHRLKEIIYILHDSIMNDHPEFKPDITIINDDEFDAIALDERTELIVIERVCLI